MHELISLAKENSIAVFGLLLFALYLQDRIDTESTAIRQEMSTYQLDTRKQFARIEIRIERRFDEMESRLTGIETSLEQITGTDQN